MKENRAFPTDLDLNVVWPTETEASRITENKDDPEKESTQSEEETSEKLWNTFQQQFGSSMTQKAELQPSQVKLKAAPTSAMPSL